MSDRERHLLRRLPLIKQKWGLHHKGCQKNKVPLRKNKNFKIEKEIIKWIRKHYLTMVGLSSVFSFLLLRSSAWEAGHQLGLKIAVDLFFVGRTDKVETMAGPRKI